MRDYRNVGRLSLIANLVIVGIYALLDPYMIPLQNIYYFAIFNAMWISMSNFTFHDLVAIRRKNLVDLVDNEIINNIYVLLIIAATYLLTATVLGATNYVRLNDPVLLANILINIKVTIYFAMILIVINNLITMLKKEIYKYIVVGIMLFIATMVRYNDSLPYLVNVFINIFYPIFNDVDLNILIFLFLRNIFFFLISRYLLIAYLKDARRFRKLAYFKSVLKYLLPIGFMYLYASIVLKGKINSPSVLIGLSNLNFANFNSWGFTTINAAFISGFIIIFLLLVNDIIKNIKDSLSYYQMVAIRDTNWTFKFGIAVLRSTIFNLACVLMLEILLAALTGGFDPALIINLLGFFAKVSLLINILANLTLFIGLLLGVNAQYLIVLVLSGGICIDLLLYTNIVTFANSFKGEIIYIVAYALLLSITYSLVKYTANKKGDIL